MGLERAPPSGRGASAGAAAICWRMSGEALIRIHRSPSLLTAREDCVRGLRPGLPARTSAQLRQLQLACGKPPPAAEPNTLTIMVLQTGYPPPRGCHSTAGGARVMADPVRSKRPGWQAFPVALQVLADKVVVDEAAVGVGEPLRHRTPHLALGANVDPVHPRHRADAQGGRGEEDLVRTVGVVEVDVGLVHRDTRLARKIDHGLAADTGEDELLARRQDGAIAHRENVRAHTLAEI